MRKILAILSQTGKFWPYYLKPENTGNIILDRIKLALDITISEINLVKKGVSDFQFKLICIIIIKDWCYSCYFVIHKFIATWRF